MEQHDLCLISNPIENSKDRVKGLNSMRKKGLFCDLSIIVQGSKFTVHKSMMATASEYLFNLLKQQDASAEGKDGKLTTVELNKQITVRGFEPLVEFVYTGVLSVKHDQVLEVLSASSFLQMFNVSAKIQAYCNQVLQGSSQHQQRGASHPFAQPHIAHMLARFLGQNFMQQPPSVQRMAPLLNPHAISALPDASAFAAVLNEKFMPSNLANIQNSIRMEQDQAAAAANQQQQQHKIVAASHDTLGLEQMIDPVQLQQMRQYAAGIRVNDVKSRVGQQQQQQQRIQQSQNTKPVTPPSASHHKASREPKGQYADKIKSLKMSNNNIMMSSSSPSVVATTEASRPSSADEITAKKQKMSTDMNRDRSDLADAKIRLKRNRSFDTTPLHKQEVLASSERSAATNHNLNNNNNNSNNGLTLKAPDSSPLRRKSRDSDLTAVDDSSKEEATEKTPTAATAVDENSSVQYQQENQRSTEVPSCSYNQGRSKTPQKQQQQQQQRNGQLMALLQPGETEKSCNKSGKAMVDEFANNVLSQQQEGYRHLLEHFSGDNVIQYLSHQQQRPHLSQPSWMHVGSKQIFQAIKAQNQSPNGSATQREVDLPKLPPSGRYSTVRRRTLQSNKPKPFNCKICHSTFTRYHNLKQHVKLHSGIKPYTCHICSKSFTRNYTLKLHRAKHFAKGGSTLRCQMCPASFDDPSTYDTHIRMSHAQMSQYRERSVSNEELTLEESDYVSERERSDSQSSYKANGGYSSPSSQEGDGGNYKNYYIKQEVNSKDSYKMHSKVRYGLDSPGGSSGDGMMTGTHSSPNESPSYSGESDDMPTDLTVMKKGSDEDEDEEEELMIAENDHPSNQQVNIKREMQRGIAANGQ